MHHRHAAMLAALFLILPLHAEPALIVTLPGVGDRVRAQNPDLAAARLLIQEALGRAKQSGRLPNPALETAFEHDTRFREGKIELGISQRFPVTQRLRVEKEISTLQVQAAEAEVREIERRIIIDARQVVVRILAMRQHRELLQHQSQITKEWSAFLTESASKGEGSAIDAGQANLEAATLAIALRQIDAAEATAEGELKPLLGMSPGTPLVISGTLPPADPSNLPIDLAGRPDLQAANIAAAAALQNISLEESKRREDIEGGLFLALERSEDAPMGLENEGIVGVRLKIPLPWRDKNEGNIEAAQADARRKLLEATALDRRIHLDAETARKEIRQWSAMLHELDATIIPLASDQAAAAETAHRSGFGDIQAVFRAREKHLQLTATRIDALREFHLARIRGGAF